MQRLKKLIIVIAIVIIILIICLVAILLKINEKTKLAENNTSASNSIISENSNIKENETTENNENLDNSLTNSINEEENKNVIKPKINTSIDTIFDIKSNIETFLNCINSKDTQELIALLNNDYVKANDITSNNVLGKIKKYNNVNTFRIIEIYNYEGTTYKEYYVKGKIDNTENIYYVISFDTTNKTFDLVPIDGNTYNKIIAGMLYDNLNAERTIEYVDSNNYVTHKLDKQDIAKNYFNEYVKLMSFSPNDAYELLETNYKNNNFATFEKFNSYLNTNKSKIQAILVENSDDGSQYFNDFDEYKKFVDSNEGATFSKYAYEQGDGYYKYEVLTDNGSDIIFIININNPCDYSVQIKQI